MRQQRFTPQRHFLVLTSVGGWLEPQGLVRLEGLGNLKKFSDVIENRTRDLPTCSIVPLPLRYRVPLRIISRIKPMSTF
jgi:hypothetical protein